MATTNAPLLLAPSRLRRDRLAGRFPRPRTSVWVALVAAATVLVRLPFLARPLTADEGGMLLVGSQWRPGTSLYGDYWVDRPPVLVDVFALADRLGGVVGLRVIGLVLVVVSVLLAARIARLAGGSPVAAALTAGLVLVHPLFGALAVNGELVAMPAVLAAIALGLAAARAPSRARWAACLVAAGAAGAVAALVKQNEVDGLLFLGVTALTVLGRRRRVVGALALVAVGALGALTAVLVQAAALGTGPAALWDAVVTFRLEADRLISSTASAATTARFHQLLLAAAVTGVPLVVLAFAGRLRRAPRAGAVDLRWATAALLVWDVFSVLGGGSYWLHYLICLLPGLVLAVTTLTTPTAVPLRRARARSRLLALALVLALASAAASLGRVATDPAFTRPPAVATWLQAHRAPGDTGVVAFGRADYLADAGLTSPYPELWSLPVRVRDPRLVGFAAVLRGPDRPDWVVTERSGSLGGWGIDARAAEPVFRARYTLVAMIGSVAVFHDRADPPVTGSAS